MGRRVVAAIALGLVGVLVGATAASGDGGPGPGVSQGWDGIAQGNERFVAVPNGSWTSIEVINRNGGRVLRWMSIKGYWGVPIVAYDGTTGGLLRDKRTLVLAQWPGRSRYSSFALVNAWKMRLVKTVRIKGSYSFDALSPDARYLYLVEHVTASDYTRYRVRAYDLQAGRLLPKIVSDRHSWETTMQGMPVSRLSSAGWAFTLYGGTAARPFIHALDTRHVAAVCIDLPWKEQSQDLFSYRLRTDGDGHLVVRGPRGRALAVIDRQSYRVLSSVRNP